MVWAPTYTIYVCIYGRRRSTSVYSTVLPYHCPVNLEQHCSTWQHLVRMSKAISSNQIQTRNNTHSKIIEICQSSTAARRNLAWDSLYQAICMCAISENNIATSSCIDSLLAISLLLVECIAQESSRARVRTITTWKKHKKPWFGYAKRIGARLYYNLMKSQLHTAT